MKWMYDALEVQTIDTYFDALFSRFRRAFRHDGNFLFYFLPSS